MGGSSSTPTKTTTSGWMPEQEMLSQQFGRYLMGLNVVPPATPTTQPTQTTTTTPTQYDSTGIPYSPEFLQQREAMGITSPSDYPQTTPSPIDQYISEMQGEGYKPLWQQPATGYTGQMTAGWNPEQQQALQTYGNIAAGPGTPAFETQRDVMAAPLRRILSEQTLPAMREQYGAQGLGLSTPLMQLELQAKTGLEENVAAQLAGQQMGALQGLATQAGAKQATGQTALTNQYNEWLRTRPEYSPWLQYLQTYLGKTPKETIVTT